VRAAGVMGCLKVWHLSPETIKDSDLVDTLYGMIRDREPQVVVNCLSALNEILQHEGGMAINKLIIHHLLNRIKEFNEWSQCVVLDMVARYKPETQQETFDIMNLL
jgi:AP-4 complex subunit beta-1